MYLGVDVCENMLTVALTENSEPVATLTEPLPETTFARFCDTALGIIAELAREYDPKAICLTGVPGRIVYLNAEGRCISGFLSVSEKAEYIRRVEQLCGLTLCKENGLLAHFANVDKALVPADAYTFSTVASYLSAALCDNKRPVFHTSEAFDVGFYSNESKDFDSRAVVKCKLADLRYPEVASTPSVIGYFDNIPVSVALGRNQARFLGSADRGGALVELRKNEFVSYFASKAEKQPLGTIGLPLSDGYDLFVRCDSEAAKAYDALLSFVARVSVSVGGSENVARTVGELALSALNEASLPKIRFEQGRLKLASDFDGFTPDRLCAAFVKETARRLCFVSKTPTKLILSGKSRIDSEAFRHSLSHVFGVDVISADMTFAAAVGAARFAAEASDRI